MGRGGCSRLGKGTGTIDEEEWFRAKATQEEESAANQAVSQEPQRKCEVVKWRTTDQKGPEGLKEKWQEGLARVLECVNIAFNRDITFRKSCDYFIEGAGTLCGDGVMRPSSSESGGVLY